MTALRNAGGPLFFNRYLPINNRIPANSARTPVTREGIGKRTSDDRPVRISQSAKSSIPIETTPIVI
jgi:hypothetical protein